MRNPFKHPLVAEWVAQIPSVNNATFAEPFGGANNIIKLFVEAYPDVQYAQWKSYDIDPEAVSHNQVPEIPLIRRDTLLNPVQAKVAVTNPPYLAKNSATRLGYKIDFGRYQDLYEIGIAKMLDSIDYVAAIIPESFLTRKLFKERLYGFVSITTSLFDDTDFPVGLALWVPQRQKDYLVYVGDKRIGYYNMIKDTTQLFRAVSTGRGGKRKIIFNDPQGILGLQAIDNTLEDSILFTRGESIPSESIKISSRAITRIKVVDQYGKDLITAKSLDSDIASLNKCLKTFREETSDLFLTSFKGLRRDGKYRRRLDFKTASFIINAVDLGR